MIKVPPKRHYRENKWIRIQLLKWISFALLVTARALQQAEKAQSKADKKRIRQLEQELRRKDKALAEAAALLILQKKLDAYWSNVDEAD